MVDQAPISGNYSDGQQPEGVVGSVTEFGSDITTLAELQAKLALIDLKASTQSATIPAAILGAGALLLLGAVPVALAGAGLLLAAALKIEPAWGLLIVAGIAMVVGGVAAAVAGSRTVHSFDYFRRSRDEMLRNIAWVRTVLLHSGRSRPRQRR